MRVLETMADLVADTQYTNGETVFVNGYHNPVLGGGGEFYYDPGDNDSPEYDGLVFRPAATLPNNPNGNGRWKRINFEKINAKFCGARGNGKSFQNDGPAIQTAIDFANERTPKGGVVYIPQGTYYTSEITLKDGVSITGDLDGTELKPYQTLSSAPYFDNQMVKIDDGPVSLVNVSNLTFGGLFDDPNDPNDPPKQIEADMHCIHINSNSQTSAVGGLWESSFKNIKIRNFRKTGLRFQGGTVDTNFPNQFILLENVRVLKSSNTADSRALYMHGQNGQFTFTNCTFSGPKNEPKIGKNVEIQGIDDVVVNGQTQNRPKCSVINFNTCIFEEAETAILINTCITINIWGCWFENLKFSVNSFNSIGTVVSNNRFSNASNYGVITTDLEEGYILVSTKSGSSFYNNTIRGGYAYDQNVSGDGGTVIITSTETSSNLNYNGFNNNRSEVISQPGGNFQLGPNLVFFE